jgi:predicted metal-dependent hydrolase
MSENGYPEAYISYLIEFHASRDYFECHELLEEYWKDHPGDRMADTWVGLIQLAVGSYHYRRGNRNGAAKMLKQSISRLTEDRLEALGLNGAESLSGVKKLIGSLENGASFTDITLPVRDDKLRRACEQRCHERGLQWGVPSGNEASLVHRHTLRDRSGVIAERAAAAAAKRRQSED